MVVPGHGPVVDRRGPQMVRDYLTFVQREATERHSAGMPATEAARDIELGEFREWTDSERLAVNVHAVYADLDPAYVPAGVASARERDGAPGPALTNLPPEPALITAAAGTVGCASPGRATQRSW